MVRGRGWTGFEAVALQEAMRKSIREFAGLLGIDTTTVTNWRSGLSSVMPRPQTQAILDTTLELHATADDKARFEQLVAEGEQVWRERHAAPGRQVAAQPDTLAVPEVVPPLDGAAHVLAQLDNARAVVDYTVSLCSVSPSRIALLEERVAEHIQTYTTTPPGTVLGAVMPDLLEVQSIAMQRQPGTVQSRLSEMSAVLSLLVADALMKLGEINRANYWYATARLAADDTANLRLRARVRAQHAMLPYYYGRVEKTLELARDAQGLLPGVADDATALAAAAEARALARLGDLEGAEHMMAQAQRLTESLAGPASDEAFRFTDKRLLLYLSGTLTYMGEIDRARRVQAEALDLYRQSPEILIDPALIHLDAAIGHVTDGQIDDACQLATQVMTALPADHRTTIVTTRANDVIQAVPESGRQLRTVGELRELVVAQTSEQA